MIAISPAFGAPNLYDMMDFHIGDEITVRIPTRWLEAWFIGIQNRDPAVVRLIHSDGTSAFQIALYPLLEIHTQKGSTKTVGPPPFLFIVENLPAFLEDLEHLVYTARNYGGGYHTVIQPECTPLMKQTVAQHLNLHEGCPPAWCNPWSCPAFHDKIPVAFYRN